MEAIVVKMKSRANPNGQKLPDHHIRTADFTMLALDPTRDLSLLIRIEQVSCRDTFQRDREIPPTPGFRRRRQPINRQ